MNSYFDDIIAILKRPIVVFVSLVVLSLVCCGVYAAEGENGPIHSIQKSCNLIILPLSNAGSETSSKLTSLLNYLDDQMVDEDSLRSLKSENAKLKQQLVLAENYKNQATRLQELLNLKDKYNVEGQCAYVIGRTNSAWNQTITINLGSDNDVCPGQVVLSDKGVLGQVISVNPTNSIVRLLSDPNSGVAIKIKSNNADGILRGSLDGVLYIDDMDINASVNVSDVVVTSGLGGTYIDGLLVGSVYQVIENSAGEGKKIAVTPYADLNSSMEVFVVSE